MLDDIDRVPTEDFSLIGKQFTNGTDTVRVIAVSGWDGLKKEQQRDFAKVKPWLHQDQVRSLQFVVTKHEPTLADMGMRKANYVKVTERTDFLEQFREVDHAAPSSTAA
jgi:hypothetical protein